MSSSYKTALTMFRVIYMLLLFLQPIVSRQIPMNNKGLRPLIDSEEENEDQEKNNTDGICSETTPKPLPGDGHFRDPLEILGKDFRETKIRHLCKANIYMYADLVSDVTFPSDSTKLCRAVCRAYQRSMYLEPGVTVSLINSNCDYTGDTIIVERTSNATHAAKCPDLSTACVCAYNIRCQRKTKLMKYTLTPNERGYLKVLASDCGSSSYVT